MQSGLWLRTGLVALAGALSIAATAPSPAPLSAQPPVPIQTPTAVTPASPQVSLKIIPPAVFCRRLTESFAAFGTTRGIAGRKNMIAAVDATARLVQEFREGKASDFINPTSLGSIGTIKPLNEGEYIVASYFVSSALGFQQPATLALSAGELRFLPYAQQGMELVVIANNGAALTPARAKAAADVAKRLNIKISVVWSAPVVGSPSTVEEAKQLALLAASTGGGFVDLSGRANPCGGEVL